MQHQWVLIIMLKIQTKNITKQINIFLCEENKTTSLLKFPWVSMWWVSFCIAEFHNWFPSEFRLAFWKKRKETINNSLCNSPDFYFSFLLIPFCYTISRPRTIKKKRWRHDTPGGAAQLLFRSFPSILLLLVFIGRGGVWCDAQQKIPRDLRGHTARHTKTACVRPCLI